MQTWNVFSNSDIVFGLFGVIGFASVVAVMTSASSSVGKREIKRRQAIDSYISSVSVDEEGV